MRKRVQTKKFNRSHGHKNALRRNLLNSLFIHGRIITTLPKAKYIRPFAEKLVTRAQKDTKENRSLVRSRVYTAEAVDALFESIAPRFTTRPGGYTRITKIGPRKGDAVEMAVIEFV